MAGSKVTTEGSSWDAVAFEQTRIAKRNYEFKGSGLNDLHAG
jgi:hypothetical protein